MLFCKSYSKLEEYSSSISSSYLAQSLEVIHILLAVASLLDIEDRLFVNRFPYRAQVFSFTEKLIRRFREEKTVFEKAKQENNQKLALSLLNTLCEAVQELVEACRERLTGDVGLKRAESMALRPGGPLPKCLYNVRQDQALRTARGMSVTLRCRVEATATDQGIVKEVGAGF